MIVDYLKQTLTDFNIYNPVLAEKQSALLVQNIKLSQLLLRPEISIHNLIACDHRLVKRLAEIEANEEQIVNAETLIKYQNYIEKEEEMVKKFSQLDHIKIAADFNYDCLTSIAKEAREKLNKVKPVNLGQASRISGVNPADITALMIYLQQR